MKNLREEAEDVETQVDDPVSKENVRNEIPEKTREREMRRRKNCGGGHRVW
jgi:hypothetical protein